VTDPPKAVFLSYASQDAEAAQRLRGSCTATGQWRKEPRFEAVERELIPN